VRAVLSGSGQPAGHPHTPGEESVAFINIGLVVNDFLCNGELAYVHTKHNSYDKEKKSSVIAVSWKCAMKIPSHSSIYCLCFGKRTVIYTYGKHDPDSKKHEL
jgi:hypothetical protein